jgi:hypothetical protein
MLLDARVEEVYHKCGVGHSRQQLWVSFQKRGFHGWTPVAERTRYRAGLGSGGADHQIGCVLRVRLKKIPIAHSTGSMRFATHAGRQYKVVLRQAAHILEIALKRAFGTLQVEAPPGKAFFITLSSRRSCLTHKVRESQELIDSKRSVTKWIDGSTLLTTGLLGGVAFPRLEGEKQKKKKKKSAPSPPHSRYDNVRNGVVKTPLS